MSHPDRSVRFQAATALGRIGDLQGVSGLLPALDETDLFARYASFTALNRIGRSEPRAWPAIAMGLDSDKAAIREAALFAFRGAYEVGAVEALASYAANPQKPSAVRKAVAKVLADLDLKAGLERKMVEHQAGRVGAPGSYGRLARDCQGARRPPRRFARSRSGVAAKRCGGDSGEQRSRIDHRTTELRSQRKGRPNPPEYAGNPGGGQETECGVYQGRQPACRWRAERFRRWMLNSSCRRWPSR